MAAAITSSPILIMVVDFGLGLRRPGCLPFLGEGIFVHDGLAWKHSREVLRRQFARVQANNLEIFEEFVEDLVSSFANPKERSISNPPSSDSLWGRQRPFFSENQ